MKKLTLCAVSACAILLSAAGAQAENIKNLSSTDSDGINNPTSSTWTAIDLGTKKCSNGVVMPQKITPKSILTQNVISIPKSPIGGGITCKTIYEDNADPIQRVTVTVGFGAQYAKFTTSSDNSMLATPETYGFLMGS